MWASFKTWSLAAKAGTIAIVLAILLAIIGTTSYVSYNKGLEVSRAEIAKYENNVWRVVANAREIQGRIDVKTVTVYKDRLAYVDRVQYKTNTVIKTLVPEQSNLSKGWIYVYNQSTRGAQPEAAKASDPAESIFSDRAALATIAENNAICLANKAQLDALQTWVIVTGESLEEASSN